MTTDRNSSKSAERVALLIDWANARGADYRKVVHWARSLGKLEFATAYGAWGRQETRDDEKLFLALGIDMVHCPRWPVGKESNGATRFKCTDDSLFHRDLMRLLWTRPEINVFVLVGADTDSLASACLAGMQDREVVVMFNPDDGSLGHVMRLADFQFEELPMLERSSQASGLRHSLESPPTPFGDLPQLLIEESRENHNCAPGSKKAA
jgi:hypothetical protein